MAMAVRKTDEEDEPPRGGELSEVVQPIAKAVRSIATPKRVVEHGVYRIASPDPMMSRVYGAYRQSVEIPKAADAASISYDDEERTRLDVWLAHACPIEYTAAIKTRSNPDPDKDWRDVDGIRTAAPQRMRRVKRLVRDEDTGAIHPVWELEPDTKLTPDLWKDRPAQYIDDWSELGVQRARKAYLKRAKLSQDKRADLGKSRLEPPTLPNTLVRRPPSVMWFLRNPDGRGLIHDEVYPHGIVDEGANMQHNKFAAEATNNLKYNGRGWEDNARVIGFSLRYYQEMSPELGRKRGMNETDCLDAWYSNRHDLDAYAMDLKSRESSYPELQHEQEVVTGVVSALENLTKSIAGRDGMVQKGTKAQTMARFKPRGEISAAPPP